jgi:3-phenylpropionate/trans-cinnamate dioxygenase ferredoxin component
VNSSDPAAADFVDVAAERDVRDGKLLGVKLADGTRVCLYNLRGTIGAVGGTCTHAEYPMDEGTLRADGTIECGWHGARFDCRTGAVCRPPAVEQLPVYEVRVRNDRVLVGPLVGAAGAAERDA